MTILVSCCLLAALAGWATGAVATGDPSAAAPPRPTELSNPDDETMVLLYYEFAGIPVPIDAWVERDPQLSMAPAPDKQAMREQLRGSLGAAVEGVKTVGLIRLSMNAGLSEYDPAYGEFIVRALAPSSMVTFTAYGQRVALRFGNAQRAQVWSVPKEEAQAVRDRIRFSGAVNMDVLLRVRRAQPGTAGGTLIADVVEYDLRNTLDGTTIARVPVGP